jgi:hypothetical protein
MGAASGYEFAATGAVWEISLRTESLMVAKDCCRTFGDLWKDDASFPVDNDNERKIPSSSQSISRGSLSCWPDCDHCIGSHSMTLVGSQGF